MSETRCKRCGKPGKFEYAPPKLIHKETADFDACGHYFEPAEATLAVPQAPTEHEALEDTLRELAQGIIDEYSPCDVDETRPRLQWCNTHSTKRCGQKALYEKAVRALEGKRA